MTDPITARTSPPGVTVNRPITIDDLQELPISEAPKTNSIDEYLKSNPSTPPDPTKETNAVDKYLKKPSTSSGSTAVDQYLTNGSTPKDSNQTQIDLKNKFINKLSLKPEKDGSFSKEGDTSKYFFQANGTFFRSTGEITLPNGTKQPQAAATLNLDGDNIKETNEAILPWTNAIAGLKLTLNNDGSYRRADDNGRYLLQQDGTIFYEGSEKSKPQTYNPTKPAGLRWDTTKDKPIPGTLGALSIGLIPKTKDSFILPSSDGTPTLGEYTIKPNGDIHWTGGKNADNKHFPPLIGRFDGKEIKWFVEVAGKEYSLKTEENPDKTVKYFIDEGGVKKTFSSTNGTWEDS